MKTAVLLVCVIWSMLILTSIVIKGENETQTIRISKLLTDDDLTLEEERELENKFIRTLEVFLEFAEQTVQMNTHVDEMFSNSKDDSSEDYVAFFASCDKATKLHESMRSEIQNSQNPQEWSFFDDPISAMTKQLAYLDEMELKFSEIKGKAERRFEKLLKTSEKASESGKLVVSLVEETGLAAPIDLNSASAMDEPTIKAKGKIMIKMATLFLLYSRRLQASADKLESLGYYNSTPLAKDADVIKMEVRTIAETQQTIQNILTEAKGVLGPYSLLSYALQTMNLTTKKLNVMSQKIEDRNVEAAKRIQLLTQSLIDLEDSFEIFTQKFAARRNEL